MSKLVDPRITTFCRLINDGIEAWVRAGEVLVEITKDDPSAHDKIIAANPHMTGDVLMLFERIGRKEVYPYLLVDGSPGARLLCAFPYEKQIQLYRSTVPVVSLRRGAVQTLHKRVCELSVSEANRVFDVAEVRTIPEQRKLLVKTAVGKARNDHPHEATEIPSEPGAKLDEDPKQELKRLLSNANEEIVEARAVMVMLKLRNHPKIQRLVTETLHSLGELRFTLNELL